jgi:Domain of unknown function (DUF2382)/PRC-barrel domain
MTPDLDIDTALEWRGRTVVDRAGEKIGTLKEIYLDDAERPRWGSVHTGLFGLRETLVPLDQVQATDDTLQLPFDGDHVKDAPSLDPDVQLSADEEERLYRHYGLTAAGEDSPDAMTRSEEVVRFGTRKRERGRARLKKYIVTDYVEKKVPVRREEVRLEFDEDGEADTDR